MPDKKITDTNKDAKTLDGAASRLKSAEAEIRMGLPRGSSIEMEEAAGQAELAEQAAANVDWIQLPRDIQDTRYNPVDSYEERIERYEELGFEFHPVDRDRAIMHDKLTEQLNDEFFERTRDLKLGSDEYKKESSDHYGALKTLDDEWDDKLFLRARLPEGWSIQPSDHAMWSHILDQEGFEMASIFYKAAFYDRNAHMGLATIPATAAQEEVVYALYDYRSFKLGPKKSVEDRYLAVGYYHADDHDDRTAILVAPDGSWGDISPDEHFNSDDWSRII